MSAQICPACLSLKYEQGRCSGCGFNRAEYKAQNTALPLDSMVGKVRIGVMKTSSRQSQIYTGVHTETSAPVIVEEFFPARVAGRSPGVPEVILASQEAEFVQRFQQGCLLMEASEQKRPLVRKGVIRANNTVYGIFEPKAGANLAAQCESLADYPVYFRDEKGMPTMSINLLTIPPMPRERRHNPEALLNRGVISDSGETVSASSEEMVAPVSEMIIKEEKKRKRGLIILICGIMVAVIVAGLLIWKPWHSDGGEDEDTTDERISIVIETDTGKGEEKEVHSEKMEMNPTESPDPDERVQSEESENSDVDEKKQPEESEKPEESANPADVEEVNAPVTSSSVYSREKLTWSELFGKYVVVKAEADGKAVIGRLRNSDIISELGKGDKEKEINIGNKDYSLRLAKTNEKDKEGHYLISIGNYLYGRIKYDENFFRIQLGRIESISAELPEPKEAADSKQTSTTDTTDESEGESTVEFVIESTSDPIAMITVESSSTPAPESTKQSKNNQTSVPTVEPTSRPTKTPKPAQTSRLTAAPTEVPAEMPNHKLFVSNGVKIYLKTWETVGSLLVDSYLTMDVNDWYDLHTKMKTDDEMKASLVISDSGTYAIELNNEDKTIYEMELVQTTQNALSPQNDGLSSGTKYFNNENEKDDEDKSENSIKEFDDANY